MTISVPNSNPVQYAGNGTAVTFSFPWKIFATTDLVVGFIVSNVYTQQTTGFTVAGLGIEKGGSLTFTTAPPIGTTVDLRPLTPEIQPTEFANLAQYLPENTTNACDRLTRAVQDATRQGYTFSIHPADQEFTPWLPVPSPAVRANSSLGFDANGMPTTLPILAGALTQPAFNTLLGTSPPYVQTPAELAALVTPSNTNYPLQGDLRRYGYTFGTADATAALVQAAAVGGDIWILGAVNLASASLAALPNNAVTLLSNTNVRFANGGSITITGSIACNLFYSTNQSNIYVVNPLVTGNGNAATATTGYFWYVKATAAATATMPNLQVLGPGQIKNFGGYYWIYYDNSAGTTWAFKNSGVSGIYFVTQLGNCQGNSSTTITSCLVGFSGSDTVPYYGVVDCQVNNCTADAAFVKEIVFFWSGCQNCYGFDNKINNCGTDPSISNDSAAYAFAAYDHSHGAALAPDLIYFYDNDINGVRDAGYYGGAPNRIYIRGNRTVGQISTANGTLPKGAIALNQPVFAILENNDCDNNWGGISVVVGAGGKVKCRVNTTTNITAGGFGWLVQPSGAGSVGDVTIDGVTIQSPTATAVALRFDSNSAIGLLQFTLQNFDIDVVTTGIKQFSSDSSVPALGNVRIAHGTIRGIQSGGVGLQYQGCSNAATRAVVDDITFKDCAAGSEMAVWINSLNLSINRIVFQDLTTGSTYCWYGAGAQGTVTNVSFINVANARRYSASTDLGVALPTWTASANAYVQNLNPTVTGSGGFGTANQKQWTAGWGYDAVNAAWAPDVRLTGA